MEPLYFFSFDNNLLAYFLHFESIALTLNVKIKPGFVVEYVS